MAATTKNTSPRSSCHKGRPETIEKVSRFDWYGLGFGSGPRTSEISLLRLFTTNKAIVRWQWSCGGDVCDGDTQ